MQCFLCAKYCSISFINLTGLILIKLEGRYYYYFCLQVAMLRGLPMITKLVSNLKYCHIWNLMICEKQAYKVYRIDTIISIGQVQNSGRKHLNVPLEDRWTELILELRMKRQFSWFLSKIAFQYIILLRILQCVNYTRQMYVYRIIFPRYNLSGLNFNIWVYFYETQSQCKVF